MTLRTTIDNLIANANNFIGQLGSLSGAVQAAQTAAADAEQSAADAQAVVTGGTAQTTPAPGKIPLADANGLLDQKWLQDRGYARRALAQSLQVLASASGGGLVIADHAALDLDVGHFTLRWKGAIPDYATATLKHIWYTYEGGTTTGVAFALVSGVMRLTMWKSGSVVNTYNSPAHGAANGTCHEFVAVVTRETATVAGSVAFYMDGLLVGTVQIAAAAPVGISNANVKYLHGTGTVRYAALISAFTLYNRALTADQVLACYRHGVAYEDQIVGSSASAQYTSNFAGGADSWSAYSGCTISGATDPLAGADLTWLEVTATAASASCRRVTSTNPCLRPYKRARVTLTYYLPVSSTATQLCVYTQTASGSSALLLNLSNPVKGTATTVEFEGAEVEGLYGLALQVNGATVGDKAYFKTIVSYQSGAVVDFEPEGIQPNQWHDFAGNDLHASYPAGGVELTRWKETGQYNWTTPVTGDTTLTSIVPAGYELSSILVNNSTANAVDIKLGTSAGGTQVFAATTVAASGYTAIQCNKAWSMTAAQTLYLSSAAWNSASLAFTLRFRRIS